MNKQEKIEQEIAKTLGNFDKAEPMPENPYFYTRVKARLDKRGQKQSAFSFFLKPALLIALLLINAFTVLWYFSGVNSVYQSSTRQDLIEILSGDLKVENQQNNFLFND